MGNYYDKIAPVVASAETDGPTGTDFFISVAGGVRVTLLSRIDHDAGTGIEYRQGGEWIPVTNPKRVPELDLEQREVGGSATEIWDAAEGEDLTLDDFEDTITE